MDDSMVDSIYEDDGGSDSAPEPAPVRIVAVFFLCQTFQPIH